MFTKIDSIIWTDSKYKELSDDAKFLFIYVLTCPHRNILGYYFLPIPYGAFDLGWVSERFTKGLHELFNKGFINYNHETNMIFIKNFLKYNPLENPNQVKGAIKVLNSLPSGSINIEFVELVKSINETLSKPLLEPLIKGLYKRLGKQVDVEVDVEVDVNVEVDVAVEDTAATDSDFKNVVLAFENNGFGTINSFTKERLVDLCEIYKDDWVLDAIKESVNSNVRNLKYVEAILKRWQAEGKNTERKGGYGKPKGSNQTDGSEYDGIGLSAEELQSL